MKTHQSAKLFPLMNEEELRELANDIRRNGLQEPIVLLDDQILDGRNRERACRQAGVEPEYVDLEDCESPVAYVLSANLHRRHLNTTQRSMIAVDALPMLEKERKEMMRLSRGRGKKGREKTPDLLPGQARDDAAELTNTNPHYVSDAKRISKDAPDVAKAARNGLVNMAGAKKLATLEPKKRKDALARVAAGDKPTEVIRQIRREELAEKEVAEPSGRCRVIYADPPWQYSDSRAGLANYSATAAEDHYPTMPTDEICEIPVREWTEDDAVLFCWATFPMLPDALQVVKAWGFKYKTAFVWSKGRPNFGHYHDASCELLLIATRGSCTPDVDERSKQLHSIKRTERHSAKPECFRELIDTLYPHGRRLELFRRGKAPKGWKVWGNEA